MNLHLVSALARFKSATALLTSYVGSIIVALAFVLAPIAGAQAESSSSLTVGNFLDKSKIRKFLETDEGRTARILDNPPPSTHMGMIKVAPTALNSAEVEVDLPDGKRAVFITTTYPVTKDANGARRWEGRWKSEQVDGRPRQLANITLVSQYNEKGRVVEEHIGGGHLTAYGADYEITGVSKDFVALIKYDSSRPRTQHPEKWKEFQEKKRKIEKQDRGDARLDGTATAGSATTALSSGPVVRVLFAVSPNAASLRNWSTSVPQLVSSINQMFERSQSILRIESAGISYRAADFNDMYVAQDRGLTLNLMVDRDNANADIVVLLGLYPPSACGLAPVAPKDAKNALATILANCANLDKVIAHEIGHILGGHHLVTQDSSNDPYPWGHGFWVRIPSGFYPGKYYCAGTLMNGGPVPNSPNCILQGGAADTQGTGWADFFSTTANYYGDGTPVGNASYANMVRVTNEAGPIYAQFRDQKLSKRILPAILLLFQQLLD